MSLLGAGIAGAAALGSAIYGGVSAGRMNKRAVRFQREMFEKQGQREVDYWNMQNQYNLPSEQMQRLKDAGLNPNLVYGSGADAQAAPLKAGGAPSMPQQMSEAIDLSSVAQTALATKQIQANIDRTQAETDRIKQGTDIGQFELEARRALGQSTFTSQLAAKVQNATMQDEKEILEYRNWLMTMYDDQNLHFNFNVGQLGHLPMTGSPRLKNMIRAITEKTVEEVNNIKAGVALRDKQLGIQELEKVLKQAEVDFVELLGSTKGAGMALQLLRTILGR